MSDLFPTRRRSTPGRFPDVDTMVTRLKPSYPVYCFRPHKVRAVARHFVETFPGKVVYAVKCNIEPRVLGWLAEAGVTAFDTASLTEIAAVRERVEQVSDALGRRIKILVGKPGLDGHSNGAEQIAVRARDVGMEVVYEGIRLTPKQIVAAARDEAVHVVGLSVLSGSHVALVTDVMDLMRAEGLDDIPVVAGGIIPPADAETLKAAGVARVYTPKDFDLTAIMDQIVDLAAEGLKTAAE